jgi:hypothetical protein
VFFVRKERFQLQLGQAIVKVAELENISWEWERQLAKISILFHFVCKGRRDVISILMHRPVSKMRKFAANESSMIKLSHILNLDHAIGSMIAHRYLDHENWFVHGPVSECGYGSIETPEHFPRTDALLWPAQQYRETSPKSRSCAPLSCRCAVVVGG